MPIITISVCLALANLIYNLRAFEFLHNRANRYGSIDGLRGYLAILVFFHHYIITWYWKVNGSWQRPPEIVYENFGRVGVSIFFIITGFLFISKIMNAKGDIEWLKLFESRVFRIYPLYIFAILIISLIVFSSTAWSLNDSIIGLSESYLKVLLFGESNINRFPFAMNVIAKVQWTLKYEWFLYLSLPIISIITFKTFRFSGIILWLILSLIAIRGLFSDLLGFSTHYFIFFLGGSLFAYILHHYKFHELSFFKSKVASIISIILILLSVVYPHTLSMSHIIIIGTLFLFILMGNDIFYLLNLKGSIILGEISYSIYLLHGIILYVIFTYLDLNTVKIGFQNFLLLQPLIGMLLVIVCSLTYLFIERPCLRLGHKYKISAFVGSRLMYKKSAVEEH